MWGIDGGRNSPLALPRLQQSITELRIATTKSGLVYFDIDITRSRLAGNHWLVISTGGGLYEKNINAGRH